MAAIHKSAIIVAISLTLFLFFSPTYSLTCKSQKFTNNKLFSNCTDLPTLKAYLHWTHNVSNSSLSIGFIAPPANSTGWISWGINPTATGMVGTQALIAFPFNGTVTVKTYNISSYRSVIQSKLAFDVWDLSAEQNNGDLMIFATASLPARTEKLNQVWQVGSDVKNGMPMKHAFEVANLNSKGTLNLVGTAAAPAGSAVGPAPSVVAEAPAPNVVAPAQSPGSTSGVSGNGKKNVAFILFTIVVLVSLIIL